MSEPMLLWENPPDRGRGGTPWVETFNSLRERPGVWAAVREGFQERNTAGTTARNIRRGLYVGCAPGEFEAVARTVDSVHRVYARYVETERPTPEGGTVRTGSAALGATPRPAGWNEHKGATEPPHAMNESAASIGAAREEFGRIARLP